ncbi:helix-turn-helix domain-containing transcriptional regulator [Rickettsia asiatica]|uniref:helix-turn-helix domain-containing transcriptional regulator n=1 Tax=Rickettsia asiatica TaxID=238800 RepID=UPI001E507D0B|nr:hypothetical protein [Rickettsia asiatica]
MELLIRNVKLLYFAFCCYWLTSNPYIARDGVIARGGVAKISKEAHINRQHIYKMLSSKGNPSFDNIGSLLNTLGLQLKVETYAF